MARPSTSLASHYTRRCWDTAGWVTVRFAANSVTDRGPLRSRSKTSLRVGSGTYVISMRDRLHGSHVFNTPGRIESLVIGA